MLVCALLYPGAKFLPVDIGGRKLKPQSTNTLCATQWAVLVSRQAKSFAYGGLAPPGTDWDIHCIKVT